MSDLTWASATNGWGPVEKDMSVGGSAAGDGATLMLNGVTYAKGLGTNSVSDVVYNLGGAYGSFLSDIGIDDHQTTNGSAVFQVFADGNLVYDSGLMTPATATKNVALSMTGVQQLRLHVGDGGDGNAYDWADWANARLSAGTVTQPPPSPPPTPPPAATLPAGWNSSAIGGATGSASYSAGVYTLAGTGAGLAGTSDALDFAYTTKSGNGSIIARVSSTDGFGGISFRDGTAAGAKNVSLSVTSTGAVQFTYRSSTGGRTVTTTTQLAPGPLWLKLTRTSRAIYAYVSTNGSTWTQVGVASFSLPKTLSVGLITFSGSSTTTSHSTFDNLTLT